MPMNIQVKERGGGISCLVLEGALDLHSSTVLRQQISQLDPNSSKILVDMKKVDYIDSSGLAVFVEVYQKNKRAGGKLALYELTPAVRHVFELARLDLLFCLASSEKDALAFLA